MTTCDSQLVALFSCVTDRSAAAASSLGWAVAGGVGPAAFQCHSANHWYGTAKLPVALECGQPWRLAGQSPQHELHLLLAPACSDTLLLLCCCIPALWRFADDHKEEEEEEKKYVVVKKKEKKEEEKHKKVVVVKKEEEKKKHREFC